MICCSICENSSFFGTNQPAASWKKVPFHGLQRTELWMFCITNSNQSTSNQTSRNSTINHHQQSPTINHQHISLYGVLTKLSFPIRFLRFYVFKISLVVVYIPAEASTCGTQAGSPIQSEWQWRPGIRLTSSTPL